MEIKPTYISFEHAKQFKKKGFNIPVPHCYVHENGENYYFEFFSFYRGTFCRMLNEVYENEKKERNFDDFKTIISNESEIYFNYNQDIRKLITRIYNGKEWMNDEKSFNMNINSYDWEKLTSEDEEKLKNELPNYNDGDFNFTVYHDIISAPEQWQVVEWLRINHGIWVYVEQNETDGFIYYKFVIDKGFKSLKRFETQFQYFWDSPQKAYSAAFDYILNNNLI
jgi:hypothetical protein